MSKYFETKIDLRQGGTYYIRLHDFYIEMLEEALAIRNTMKELDSYSERFERLNDLLREIYQDIGYTLVNEISESPF